MNMHVGMHGRMDGHPYHVYDALFYMLLLFSL